MGPVYYANKVEALKKKKKCLLLIGGKVDIGGNSGSSLVLYGAGILSVVWLVYGAVSLAISRFCLVKEVVSP